MKICHKKLSVRSTILENPEFPIPAKNLVYEGMEFWKILESETVKWDNCLELIEQWKAQSPIHRTYNDYALITHMYVPRLSAHKPGFERGTIYRALAPISQGKMKVAQTWFMKEWKFEKLWNTKLKNETTV